MRIQEITITEIEASDGRKLTPEALYERRLQYVRFREAGMSNNQASALVGFGYVTGSRIWKKYKDQGLEGLKVKRRGLPLGHNRALSPAQEEEIQALMSNHTPDEIGLPYSLWSRESAQRMIAERYDIKLALRTMTLYFSRWNFTYQKPSKRAYKQNAEQIARWLEEEYPLIKADASKDKAEIYWCDETGVINESNSKRGFSPRGHTPVKKVEVKKERVNMISAVTNQGKVRFMLYLETMTTVLLITFLQRLIRETGRKIYVIMDNLRVHHSMKFNEWLKVNEDKISVHYLPPYSPELNPDEYLNGNLKKSVHSGISPRTKAEIKKKTRRFMQSQQKAPAKIEQLFKHKCVRYAS